MIKDSVRKQATRARLRYCHTHQTARRLPNPEPKLTARRYFARTRWARLLYYLIHVHLPIPIASLVSTAMSTPIIFSSTTLSSAQGVVTYMYTTPKHIIVALDNGYVHVLGHEGGNERVVKANERGLWAVDAWGDEWIVAGGNGMLGVWIWRTCGLCLSCLDRILREAMLCLRRCSGERSFLCLSRLNEFEIRLCS